MICFTCMELHVLHVLQSSGTLLGVVPSGLHRTGSMYSPGLHRGHWMHLGGKPGARYLGDSVRKTENWMHLGGKPGARYLGDSVRKTETSICEKQKAKDLLLLQSSGSR